MHNHGLGAWMAKRRLKTPDKPALIHGEGETVTYRQLADGTDRVSALLWHRGVRKGDRVAFLGENSPEFLQVLFGAAQLGAVFVPINTRLAAPEIAHVLTDSGARVLIHDPEFAERVADGVAAARVPHVIATGDGRTEQSARREHPAGTPTPTSPSTTRPRSSTPRGRPAGRREPCSPTRTSRGSH